MGDLESLLLIVGVIYLSECLVWVRRGAMAFASWWGSTARARHPGTLVRNHQGGFLLANPLPPFGAVFLAVPLPFSPSPDAVLACSATCLDPAGRSGQSARFVHWDAIRSIAVEGRHVFVNDEPFLAAPSTYSAREGARVLRRLQRSTGTERAAAIDSVLAEAFDTAAITGRLDQYRRIGRPLRLLAQLLFGYLFLILPVVLWRYGFGLPGLLLLAGLIAFTIPIAILFRRAHRELYPDAHDERFKHFLTLLLAPPAAIRALDLLGRHLFEKSHPLALARVLCRPDRLREFARCVMVDLHYPLLPACPSDAAAAVEADRYFRSSTVAAARRFLQREGIDPEELVRPPKPTEAVNQSYCPRCGAQFVTRAGTCRDCGGQPLRAFAPASGAHA